MNNDELSVFQFSEIIRKAIGFTKKQSQEITDPDYVLALEEALVKSRLKQTEQRKELRRLNQKVMYINDVNSRNKYLASENAALEDLLEKAEERDTEFDELQHEEITAVETPIAIRNSSRPPSPEINESYHDWDMRTRFPAPQKRVNVG